MRREGKGREERGRKGNGREGEGKETNEHTHTKVFMDNSVEAAKVCSEA